jgi:hypothetical protein
MILWAPFCMSRSRPRKLTNRTRRLPKRGRQPGRLGRSLFHTATGVAYADIEIDDHRETWPVRSKQFRAWLRRRHYQRTGEAIDPPTIRSILDLIEARAQFDAPELAVHIRVAPHEGRIYLDLADACWQAVEVGPDGWRIVTRPPVRFRRAPGMLPLPVPERGGSVEALASLINIPNDADFVLLLSWLLGALHHPGPFPLLAIAGEQGSAKTVLSKILRGLIDPNLAPVRALPREERDLMIAANNSHVLAFDNLSSLPSWLSDALCRIASGGSFALRQLYTDADEVLFQAARPAILNGIEDVITRQDLADRAIFLTMGSLSDEQRRPEAELWREFELARPRILGALLDAVSHGLGMRDRIQFARLPRMADFAKWAAACEAALWSPGTFRMAYDANRRRAVEDVVDADPVAAAVRTIMTKQTRWAGTASDLMASAAAGQQFNGRIADWPKSSRALAGRLRRSQAFLRTLGVEIAFQREGRDGNRIIRMTSRANFSPSAPSASSVNAEALLSALE